MANKTIAQLTAAVAAAGSNLIEIDDGAGGSFKLTLSQVLALMAATNPSVIVESGATPEKISQFTGAATPINSNYLMPFANAGIANYKYSVANLVNDIFDQGDSYTVPTVFFHSGGNVTIRDNFGGELSLNGAGSASVTNGIQSNFQLFPTYIAFNYTGSGLNQMFIGDAAAQINTSVGCILIMNSDGTLSLKDASAQGITFNGSGLITFDVQPVIPGCYTGTLAGAAGKNVVNGLIQA